MLSAKDPHRWLVPCLSSLMVCSAVLWAWPQPSAEAHERAGNQEGQRIANYILSGSSWTAQGTPVELTWSFVPDGLAIPPGDTSELFALMDGFFGDDTQLWIQRFEQAFQRWAELSGVTFTRVTVPGDEWDDGAAWGLGGSETRGDIRIAMSASGVTVVSAAPNGDMILNGSLSWNSSSNDNRFLRNLVMHLIGHSLGILNACPANGTKLMEPAVNIGFDGPQHDDIRAVHASYGDVFEPDDNAAEATDLGLISPDDSFTLGLPPPPTIGFGSTLSIDANGESDWFRFEIVEPIILTATLFPVGLTYDSSPADCGGEPPECCSGNFVDSSVIANLNLEIRADNLALLSSAGNAPAGNIELIEDLTLDLPATYFVRVFEANQPIESQLYLLQLSAISVCPPPPGALSGVPACVGSNLDCEDGDPCTSDVCDQECCVFSPRLYGDANQDGVLNIVDVICSARVIFQAATFCGDHETSLDEIDIAPSAACGDDQLNIIDIVVTARAVFQDARDECCDE